MMWWWEVVGLPETAPETKLEAIQDWLQQKGFNDVHLSLEDQVVSLQLSVSGKSRLFSEPDLREALVALIKAQGHQRIVLQL